MHVPARPLNQAHARSLFRFQLLSSKLMRMEVHDLKVKKEKCKTPCISPHRRVRRGRWLGATPETLTSVASGSVGQVRNYSRVAQFHC
jgi:hypothetical protein